jgi:hypothetical protein
MQAKNTHMDREQQTSLVVLKCFYQCFKNIQNIQIYI